jgi:hypothetical protein
VPHAVKLRAEDLVEGRIELRLGIESTQRKENKTKEERERKLILCFDS